MSEERYVDLKKTINDLTEHNARLQKEVMEYIRAEQVIAAGLITEQKVKQAHEIVQSWS